MLQQLVDNWIMDSEGSTAASPVVRITEFPHLAYEEDGFWQQVSTRCPDIKYDKGCGVGTS